MLVSVANQGRQSSVVPVETEVTDEQEQNTIARALALHFGKETQQLPQPSPAPTTNVLPVRMRSVPAREVVLQMGTTTMSQNHAGPWATDLSSDQRHLRSQPHSSGAPVSAPGYRGPSRAGPPVVLRDVSGVSGLSRDALAKSRAIAGGLGGSFGGRPAHVHVRPVQVRRDRHEVLSFEAHQRDEDEWLRGESSKPSRDTDGRSDPSEGSSVVHGSYNPMLWSGSGSLWSSMHPPTMSRAPGGAAMPVRLRPAVMVCATPPPRRREPADDAENEGEAATRKVLSQLSL